MSNCCIPYKKLDNISGSSLVTFNGKTSFDGISSITVNHGTFDTISTSDISAGTGQFAIVFTQNVQASQNITSPTIQTDILKWNGNSYLDQHYVAFKAGSLTKTTVYTLPLQDGTKGQMVITDGAANLSFSNIDIASLPILGAATFPVPLDLPTIPIPNPIFSPLSEFDWLMSGPWLPQILAGSVHSDLSDPETVISSALAMSQIKLAQVVKWMDNTGFIVKSRSINYFWDNPLTYLIPEPIKKLYGLGTEHTFLNAQALDELDEGLLKQKDGVIAIALPNQDYLSLELTENNIWIGNTENKAVMTPFKQPAPTDVTYIVQKLPEPNVLPNAQGLADSIPEGGILKSEWFTGIVKKAIENVDYPSVLSVKEAQAAAAAAAEAAAAAAAAAAEAAAIATAAAAAAAKALLDFDTAPWITYTSSISPIMTNAQDIGGGLTGDGIGTGVVYCTQERSVIPPFRKNANLSTVEVINDITVLAFGEITASVSFSTKDKLKTADILIGSKSTGKFASGNDTLNGTTGVIVIAPIVTFASSIIVTRNYGTNSPSNVTDIGSLSVGNIQKHFSFMVYSTVATDKANFSWMVANQ